ncbi:hypothetical protein C8F01DRAFT_1338910 [Mycena amicta]|nr:hypothetical protein C8F01DRAFT_1338910 [Mycena amicta]
MLLYTTLLKIVGGFCEDPPTKIQVFASPDILFVCATGWKLIRKDSRLSEVKRARHCYSSMHDLLVDHHVAPFDIVPFLPILLEATGGTFGHLADTMICHLKTTAATMSEEFDVEFPGRTLCLIIRLSPLVRDRVDDKRGRKQYPEACTLCPFWSALVSRGIVPVLLRIVSAICDTALAFAQSFHTLQQALFVLAEIFLTSPGSIHLPDAIRRGLIHSVLKIAASPLEPKLQTHLVEFLFDIIPTNIHRFAVLAALDNEMEELKKLTIGKDQRTTRILSLECWELLQLPLDDRLGLHDQYFLGNGNKFTICANMTRLSFRVFVYPAFTRPARRELTLSADAYGTNLSSRDISFLRFQLDHELASARSSIVAKQVSALANRRTDGEPVVTRFKFTNKLLNCHETYLQTQFPSSRVTCVT